MSMNPKIAMSDDFLRSFAAIAKEHQQMVITFLAKFRQNPHAPGLNYEKIHEAADERMRSLRVNDAIRAIVLKPDAEQLYCLLWVDRHDEAYRWSRRHRVTIHPDVGSIQIYAVTREGAANAEVTATAAEKSAARPALFAALKDREIRRLGVPDEKLDLVRSLCHEQELEGLETQLPDEAFEALYLFAAGESYESLIAQREESSTVDVTDFAAALTRDSTKRHFVILTEDTDLEAILSAPLERWRIFLHPDQRKLVEREWSGAVRVTGGAGTGKTVVAMHRAAWLARRYADLPGQPILFTTFTRTLAEDIRHHLRQLCLPTESAKIQVVHFDQWANSILRRFGDRKELLYDEKRRREFWQLALAVLPAEVDLPLPFFRAEYERVVLPQGCITADEYLRARRIGRGGQLNRMQRKAIWPVFAEYRALLNSAGLREPEEAFREAALLLHQSPTTSVGIRAMVVDEAQDLSAAALTLIRAAIPPQENDLFIVGDAHQRIYRHRVVLGQCGIDVRGRGRRLRINYRTTDEIRRWACAQLEGCAIDDLDGEMESLKGYRSLTHGEPPEVIVSATPEEEQQRLVALIQQAVQGGIALNQIGLITRYNTDLDRWVEVLAAQSIAGLRLDRETMDDQRVKGVRLATMHRVKGLEFDVVILAGYQGADYYAERMSQNEDAGVVDDQLIGERCLLHVASTRAKRRLVISSVHSIGFAQSDRVKRG